MGWRALVSSVALLGGCGDPVCGPDSLASEQLLSVALGGQEVPWVNFRSSPNNDCGEAGGPTSLTLEASQAGEPDQSLVLCLPRPDKISGKTIDVGDATRLRIIDVFALVSGGDCQSSLDRSRPASGSIGFHGVCDDGLAPEGYSLEFAMTLPLTVMCGDQLSEDELRFEGSVIVSTTEP